MEREVPTSAALPTALRTLPYKSSLWVWSQEGLWDLGSLGTDWEQGNLSKSWWQEFRPLIPIQPPMSQQCPQPQSGLRSPPSPSPHPPDSHVTRQVRR